MLLQPGEARKVSVTVPARMLAVYSTKAGAWKVTPGQYTFTLATASDAPVARATARVGAATIPVALQR